MKWEEGDYEGSGEKGNYRWQMQPLGCQEVAHMEVRIWKVIPLSCPFLLLPPHRMSFCASRYICTQFEDRGLGETCKGGDPGFDGQNIHDRG